MTKPGTPKRGTLALVTRPGEPGQRLSTALRDRGQRALWWPAFDLLAPAELEPLQALLQRLAEFELAVFVSPAAVRGLSALDLCGPWPAATRIAAVGASTLQLAHRLLPGAAAARGIGPGTDRRDRVLEREVAAEVRGPVCVPVTAHARQPRGEPSLHEAPGLVEYAGVYRRVVHLPSPEQRAALGASRGAGDRAVSVVTSSEAVAALDRQLAEAPDARAWLRQGLALCSHVRIAQALRAAGYVEVHECEPLAADVLQAIRGAARGEAVARMAQARAQ